MKPTSSLLHTALLGAGFGVAFLMGQWVPGMLGAQGRAPVNPPTAPPVTGLPDPSDAKPPIVYTEDNGRAVSANGFVAVTGSYGVGTSVLYLIDTATRQLAVYEARGGSPEQRRVVLVGARRIDLDLQLRGYNDRSEYEYSQLEEVFRKHDRKGAPGSPDTGPEIPSRK